MRGKGGDGPGPEEYVEYLPIWMLLLAVLPGPLVVHVFFHWGVSLLKLNVRRKGTRILEGSLGNLVSRL